VSHNANNAEDEAEWDDLSEDNLSESKGILYRILNVAQKATTQEIRESYKLLARTLHPDKNPDSKEAHKQFQMLNEAYKILSDETKRRIYDRTGEIGD
jgi:DnaJ family protein C protein 9